MSKAILIFGATGKQGSAVLRSLLAHPSFSPSAYTIQAVTRDVNSASAKRLSALSPAIKLVPGSLDDAPGTFRSLPATPWGVYTMTNPGKTETAQGINIINEAIAAGSSRFVFSSVDRGEADNRNSPTTVPHFITKHNIEAHLREVAKESAGKLTYTILRPPYFLDNLAPGFQGRLFLTLWRESCTRPMSVIDTRDIGRAAAAAFLEPDGNATFTNKELNLAGDRLTFEELDAKFRAKTGKPAPVTWGAFSNLLTLVSGDVREMAKFFQEPGFAATPEESGRIVKMTDVDEWLEGSKFVERSG